MANNISSLTSSASSTRTVEGEYYSIDLDLDKCLLNLFLLCHTMIPVGNVYEGFNNSHECNKLKYKSLEGHPDTATPPVRELVKEVETVVISDLFKKYIPQPGKIVEIGAGVLDASGNSYLMKRMSAEMAHRVQPTEVNNYIVLNPENRLDTIELSKKYAPNSVDAVIASAFLDTLDKKDLEVTLSEIYKVLKPDGVFVHVTSLMPYFNVLVADHTDENLLCFPWFDQWQLKGLQTISKETLIKLAKRSSKTSKVAQQFLTWYANLPVRNRQTILEEICRLSVVENNQCGHIFSEAMKLLFPIELKQIDQAAYFKERHKSAMQKNKFEIVDYNTLKQSHIHPQPIDWKTRCLEINKKECNYASMQYDICKTYTCYVLAPGNIYQNVLMDVIVARK